MELPSNSRNRASGSWGTFLRMLEYKCDREGTHFVAVDPRGTTKECSNCGVSTEKPLWVREHSCPSCGFEADRDANAALNICSRGLTEVGVVHSDSTSSETLCVSDVRTRSVLAGERIALRFVNACGDCALWGPILFLQSASSKQEDCENRRFSRCQGASLLEHPVLSEAVRPSRAG